LRGESTLETTTINEYERVLPKPVIPRRGPPRLRGLSVDRIDTVLQDLRAQSLNRRRQARVITGAMLETTVRHGARCEPGPANREHPPPHG
jgi:hypothetical protein